MKNSFYLLIPKQHSNADTLRVYEKKSIEQWLLELPVANASLATRLFYEYLEELNSLEASTQLRLEALESLRPHFYSIKESLRSRIIVSGFPKSEIEQKVFELLISIERNFAIGYFIIVKELTSKSVSWFQGKNAALAIQRVIKGLSSIVETYYMMFLPVPDWVWYDLHSLYKLSINIKKHKAKVSDEFSSLGKLNTIEESYKQILLLSLSAPSGLMQREVHQVNDFIEKVSPYVEIKESPIADQQIQCVIEADGDGKPYFTKKVNRDEVNVKYLDLNKLYKILQQTGKYSSVDSVRFSTIDFAVKTSEKLSAGLFNYLVKRWHGHRLKGDSIFSDRLDRYITIGLAATHSELMLSDEESSINTEILAETTSAHGLSCQFEKEGLLSIGSLISFRKKDQEKHGYPLAIVVKIIMPKQSGRILFEVDILTVQSHAVDYLNINAEELDNANKALIYQLKGKSYILMDSFIHKNGDMLTMFMNDDNYRIILGDRKNVGLGYWQFECRYLEENQVVQPTTQKGYDFI